MTGTSGKTQPLIWIIWRQFEQRWASWYSFKFWLVLGGTWSVEGSTSWYNPELFPHSACVNFFVTFRDQLTDLSWPTWSCFYRRFGFWPNDSWGNREFQTLDPWFPRKYAPVSTPSSLNMSLYPPLLLIVSDTGPSCYPKCTLCIGGRSCSESYAMLWKVSSSSWCLS